MPELAFALPIEIQNFTVTLPSKRNVLRYRKGRRRRWRKDGERMRMMEIGFCPYTIRA